MSTNKSKRRRACPAKAAPRRAPGNPRKFVELEFPTASKGRVLVEPTLKGTLKKGQYVKAVTYAAMLHKTRLLGKKKRVIRVSSKDIEDSLKVSVALP